MLYIVFRRVMESGESHPHIRHVLSCAVVISLATRVRGPRFDSKAKWRQTGNLLYSMPPAHPLMNEYWVSVMAMSCLTIGFGCDVSFQMFPKISNFSSSLVEATGCWSHKNTHPAGLRDTLGGLH